MGFREACRRHIAPRPGGFLKINNKLVVIDFFLAGTRPADLISYFSLSPAISARFGDVPEFQMLFLDPNDSR